MIIVNAEKIATELADKDKIFKTMRLTKRFVEEFRLSAEWQERYKYYLDVINSYA